jgi:small-conductance mechanosensitive channel
VLPDLNVDVLYLAPGVSAKEFLIRCWIDDVNKRYRILDRVNVALNRTLDEAGIDTPNRLRC